METPPPSVRSRHFAEKKIRAFSGPYLTEEYDEYEKQEQQRL
jgi:hypothetical protein